MHLGPTPRERHFLSVDGRIPRYMAASMSLKTKGAGNCSSTLLGSLLASGW